MGTIDVIAFIIAGYAVLLWRLHQVTQEYKEFKRETMRFIGDIATKQVEVTLNDDNSLRISRRKPAREVQAL